jgi:Arc/MetJ-type ribon-helix-helix transcriptional regulator
MTTVSVPLTRELDEFIEEQVRDGNVASKADLIRKAINLYKEEKFIKEILLSQKEVRDGKVIEFLGKEDFKKKLEKMYG